MSNLTIYGFAEAKLNNERELLAALDRLGRMSFGDGEVTLDCSPRQDSGFLDWVAAFFNGGKCVFTLGCIQRGPTEEMEFHS